MADEQETIAPAALETPASATEATTETTAETIVDEPQRIPDTEEEEGTQDEPATGEVEEETIEVEWDDGKKYKIPKVLETGILKNKDYTTKTQEVSTRAKALEAKEAAIEERLKATDEELDARADLRKVSKTLEEYSKLTPDDWAAHEAADASTTQNHWRNFQLLKDQKAELEGKIGKAQTERSSTAQQALAKRVEETVAAAPKIIPGWKPETGAQAIKDLVSFAQSLEIPDQVLESNWSPQLLKLLHRAQLGENLLKKQATAPKLPNPNPGKPLEKVGGTGSPAARGDLASGDMATYIAARKSGVGGKSPLR